MVSSISAVVRPFVLHWNGVLLLFRFGGSCTVCGSGVLWAAWCDLGVCCPAVGIGGSNLGWPTLALAGGGGPFDPSAIVWVRS